MKVIPQSEVKFYSNIETSRPLAFSKAAKLATYFTQHLFWSASDFTVVKKSSSRIRIPVATSASTAFGGINGATFLSSNVNYMSFKNPIFENKVIYARVVDIDYVNNETVEVVYAINWWLTFMHDVNYRSGYIDREHLSESDYQKSLINPYDPSIAEFRTPEPLVMSKELEPNSYTYGVRGSTGAIPENSRGIQDYAFEIGRALPGSFLSSWDNMDVMMYFMAVNPITPSSQEEQTWWNNFKADCKSLSYSGYALGIVEANKKSSNGYLVNLNRKALMQIFNYTAFAPALPEYFYLDTNLPLPYDIYIFVDHVPATSAPAQNYMDIVLQHLAIENSINCVLGIYAMPAFMFLSMCKVVGIADNSKYSLYNITKYWGDSIDSKKLLLSPYSYLRVTSPNNDEKEYFYERFYTLYGYTPNNDSIKDQPIYLHMGGNFGTNPYLTIAPALYKTIGANTFDPEDGTDFGERFNFKAFPQIPYNTDAFLTYLGATAQALMRSNTVQTRDNMVVQGMELGNEYEHLDRAIKMGSVSTLANEVFEIADAFPGVGTGGGTGNYLGAAMNALGNYGNRMDQLMVMEGQEAVTARQIENLRRRKDEVLGADDLSPQNLESSIVYENYGKGTKASFVHADYHPGTVDGTEYYQECALMDILITQVHLRDDIAAKYDNWFKAFGYNSQRYGKPHIMDFVKGSSDNTKLPHFATVDGFKITYIKTNSIDIDCPFKIVEDYFKAMFNMGTQIINGDTLITT